MSADHQEIDLRKFFFVSVVPIGYKFVHLTIGGNACDVHAVIPVTTIMFQPC